MARCARLPLSGFAGLPPKGETTHYDLCVAGAPSNHVRCASTGKRVTRFSGRFASLRIVFPCHPYVGGRIGRSMLSCRDMAPWLSIHSPTTKWGGGRWWRQPPKGECISSSGARLACFPTGESPVVKVLYKTGAFYNLKAPTSPVERYFIPPEGGALNPPVRRQPITGRTLGAQGQRPGGAINPRPRKRASTFGNTAQRR